MRLQCVLLFLFLLLFHVAAKAQSTPYEDSVKRMLATASLPQDRMHWMHELSRYYMGQNNELADNYGRQMLEMADSSRDRALMCKAYLNNADRYFTFGITQENMRKGMEYCQKALDIARANNMDDYTAWAYMYFARGYRGNGENEKALSNNNLALSIAADSKNDSIRVGLYNSLGNTYVAKNEKLLAYRNFLQAMDIAGQSDNYTLLNDCYSELTEFYSSLDNYEKAKDVAFKQEALQLQHNRPYDLLDTYNRIGQLYAGAKQQDQARKYFEKSLSLADSLRFTIYKINSYMNIVNLYLNNNQFAEGLAYFKQHPELTDFMNKTGSYLIDQAYGIMYALTNQPDSAKYYFVKAEPGVEAMSGKMNRFWFYSQYAFYFSQQKDYDQAIAYWMKAQKMGEETGSLDLLQRAALHLDSLYQWKNDFKKAYAYNSLYHQYKDSAQALAKEKDLLTLDIDNEKRRKDREILQEEEATRRRHNIQYMGITIAIAGVFVLLVMAGALSVSRNTIKVLGFFAFIFFFEFIILLADNQIHHWTHGEPWKVLLIKIGLIAILLPLHHWLEEKVFHYLTTQELLRVKGKSLVGKLFRKKDTDLPMGNL